MSILLTSYVYSSAIAELFIAPHTPQPNPDTSACTAPPGTILGSKQLVFELISAATTRGS